MEELANAKPVVVSDGCKTMFDTAFNYIAENSVRQAHIFQKQFYGVLRLLERFPQLGSRFKWNTRRILLGKFRYYVYYRKLADCVEVLGIWHTSRGTEFAL